MIRTPPPPFLQTFNLRGPAADVLFIKGDANGKEEGKKKRRKKVHGCYLSLIRQEVSRDALALAATSRLIMSPCRAICLTEKLLRTPPPPQPPPVTLAAVNIRRRSFQQGWWDDGHGHIYDEASSMSHWCKHTDSLDPAMGWSGIEALRRKVRRFRIWKFSEVHSDASQPITDHHNHTIATQNTITTQACQSAAREDPSSLSYVLCPVAANVYKLAASLLPWLSFVNGCYAGF